MSTGLQLVLAFLLGAIVAGVYGYIIGHNAGYWRARYDLFTGRAKE